MKSLELENSASALKMAESLRDDALRKLDEREAEQAASNAEAVDKHRARVRELEAEVEVGPYSPNPPNPRPP